MRYKIEIGSIWEFGERKDENGKPHQEDSLFPAYGEQKETDRVFVLCDGMGGHAAGEVASKTVCDAMSAWLLPKVGKNSFKLTDDDVRASVNAAFDALDALDTNSSGKSKMGTTMTFLALHDDGATLAHMGDSRIYHLRPGNEGADTRILFQTRDHSLVNDLVAIGEITPEEAKTHPRRNVITRAMQPHIERPDADIHHITDIREDDWFFLCSDGMLEQMEDFGLRYFFSHSAGDMPSKIEALRTATTENRDNHTAILVHILKVDGNITQETVSETKTSRLIGIVSDDSDPSLGSKPIEKIQSDTQDDQSTAAHTDENDKIEEKARKKTLTDIFKSRWFLPVIIAVFAIVAVVLLVNPVKNMITQWKSKRVENIVITNNDRNAEETTNPNVNVDTPAKNNPHESDSKSKSTTSNKNQNKEKEQPKKNSTKENTESSETENGNAKSNLHGVNLKGEDTSAQSKDSTK